MFHDVPSETQRFRSLYPLVDSLKHLRHLGTWALVGHLSHLRISRLFKHLGT